MRYFLFFIDFIMMKGIEYKPVHSSAFLALEDKEFKEDMYDKVRSIMNSFLSISGGECHIIERVDNRILEKIKNPINLSISKPYINGLKHFVYYHKERHHWTIQNYQNPEYSILNLLNTEKRLNVYLYSKELKNEMTESYINEKFFNIYHIKDIEIGYFGIESTNFEMLKVLSKENDNEYALLIPEDMTFNHVEFICKQIEDSDNITLYQKTKSYLYRVRTESNTIIHERLYIS